MDALFDSIFAAYFDAGQDIELGVLVSLAAGAGFDAYDDVRAAELSAMVAGVSAVPSVRIADMTINGAQAATLLVDALRTAEAALASC